MGCLVPEFVKVQSEARKGSQSAIPRDDGTRGTR